MNKLCAIFVIFSIAAFKTANSFYINDLLVDFEDCGNNDDDYNMHLLLFVTSTLIL